MKKIILFLLCSIHMPSIGDPSVLPPEQSWQGKSETLIRTATPWQTPAEKLDFKQTPDYLQTIKFLKKLVSHEPQFVLRSIGKSPQGREIYLVIASQDGAQTPAELKQNHKPTLFVQAGIHSGEIDGKDAGMMLLRDISKGDKQSLLDRVNLLFLPILNVDGHENRSPFHRVNQRGPQEMGWRTTAENLNLNRDYAKADSLEMQHLLNALNRWQPDLYLDIHVTDGADYQYDITYGFNGAVTHSPQIKQWLTSIYRTDVDSALNTWGHLGGPLIFGIDNRDFSKGLYGWTASPRFSNGYGDVRHLPTVLVENHSLKPYRQRVLGTYILLEQSLKSLASHGKKLREAIKKDQSSRPQKMTLKWKLDKENPETIAFAGIKSQQQKDPLTGLEYVVWTGEKQSYPALPVFWVRQPDITVEIPRAYYIPPQYQTVLHRLTLHGIRIETLDKETSHRLEQLSLISHQFSPSPYEGHLMPTGEFSAHIKKVLLPAGTVKVSTDQPLGRLAVALLDPRGPDSFFSWGFFNTLFQRTEYIESYALIPLAHKLMKDDPTLKNEFRQFMQQFHNMDINGDKPAEQSARNDIMSWLYQRSPYYDQRYLKYPVLLEPYEKKDT